MESDYLLRYMSITNQKCDQYISLKSSGQSVDGKGKRREFSHFMERTCKDKIEHVGYVLKNGKLILCNFMTFSDDFSNTFFINKPFSLENIVNVQRKHLCKNQLTLLKTGTLMFTKRSWLCLL